MRSNRFNRGSGCYECRSCGKMTRSTGRGDNENVGLCAPCFDRAGDENAVSDGLMTEQEFNQLYPKETTMNATVTVRKATKNELETINMLGVLEGVQLNDWILVADGKHLGYASSALTRAAAVENFAKVYPDHAAAIGAQPAKKPAAPKAKAAAAPKAKKPAAAPKAEAAPKAKSDVKPFPKPEGRTARMFAHVLAGKSNAKALELIKKEFKGCPTNLSSIGWVRSQLRNNPKRWDGKFGVTLAKAKAVKADKDCK